MNPFAAALLSFLFPGLGQAAIGKISRAQIMALPTLAVGIASVAILLVYPNALFAPTPSRTLLVSLLGLDVMLGLYHVWAVLDAYNLAYRARRLDRLQLDGSPRKWVTVLSVAVLVTGTVGVHAAVAEASIAWQHNLGCTSGAAPCAFDISYPQCGAAFPENADLGIVGVNHGIVFSANPCLGRGVGPDQLTWAGGVKAQLYANTGNPGPELSSKWPKNQSSPRQCDTADVPGPDTADCAYDYGWNAASDSYRTAVDAYVGLGLAPAGSAMTPSPNMWWLDVETVNSWRPDTALNTAVLSGAVAFLQTVRTAGIGIYSTQYQWNVITGGTTHFAALPSWVAGATSAAEAIRICRAKGFTGGRVALVQYHAGGFDADFPCPAST